jgi:hypothetical protein
MKASASKACSMKFWTLNGVYQCDQSLNPPFLLLQPTMSMASIGTSSESLPQPTFQSAL